MMIRSQIKMGLCIVLPVLLGGCTVYQLKTPDGYVWTNQPQGYVAVPQSAAQYYAQPSTTIYNQQTRTHVNVINQPPTPAPNPQKRDRHRDITPPATLQPSQPAPAPLTPSQPPSTEPTPHMPNLKALNSGLLGGVQLHRDSAPQPVLDQKPHDKKNQNNSVAASPPTQSCTT
jgi:hypothetical protein